MIISFFHKIIDMNQDIFVVGATGKVGRELLAQVYANDVDPEAHRNPTSVVGLADSSSYLYDEEGISAEDALRFSNREAKGALHRGLPSLVDLLRDKKGTVHVIDVTAAQDALGLHMGIINDTRHSIVTANKIPLAYSGMGTFRRLVSETQRYGFRCSVMAGAEAVDFVRDLADVGDRPRKIEGCFSGTLGFITTGLERGVPLSSIVVEAIGRGYTEPDPANDLDGSDVAKKILILARLSGSDVRMEDIRLSPFVSDDCLVRNDPKGLIDKLRSVDSHYSDMVGSAKERGKVLRYVARMHSMPNNARPTISVGLEEVDRGSPLGQLSGMLNKIVVTTGTYNENGYVVEAPGAGVRITAQNIRRDLLHQLNGRVLRL